MKANVKIGLLSLGGLLLILGLSLGFGWFDVFYTKTVGKAKQDAQREVFENTQSYVEGKRQEAIKIRLEYMRADSADQEAIRMVIIQSFANFDEEKLPDELRNFIHDMKYNL